MKNDKELFGSNVRKYRIAKNLTQEALGYLAGMQQPAVGKIERGESNTTIQNMSKLSEALGVEMAELFRLPETDMVSSYLPDLSLKQLPEPEKHLTLTLLKLISVITNEEIETEIYEILYQQICRAVRFTHYQLEDLPTVTKGIRTYGIRATEYIMGKASRTARISDISSDTKTLTKLIAQMNHSFLSIEHFKDVVEDFLSNDTDLNGLPDIERKC